MAERYAAALDMAEWADRLGFSQIWLLEHHGSSDGYIPSPLTIFAAMSARTQKIRMRATALVAPFYDPLNLAEQICVLDHLSRGRIDYIIGAGYVQEEFEMFGVPMHERPRRVTEVMTALHGAFTGRPFRYRDRTVEVTPAPFQPGGPEVVMGGSSEGAARRAARLGFGFYPSAPEYWAFYRDESARQGRPDPGPNPHQKSIVSVVAADVEKAWARLAPYFLYDVNAYGEWQARPDSPIASRAAPDADTLRAAGTHRIYTPAQMVAELKAADTPMVMFNPMCGGIPPELAWESLRLFEREVLPALV